MAKKSVYHGKDYLYKLLMSKGAKSFINGKIYKDKRPSDVKTEDIVINAISVDNQFLQDGVFNVNCYVPFREEVINGVKQYFPNNERLKEVFEAINPMLENQYEEEFNCDIVNHQNFDEEQEKSSYINFRVNLKIYN